MLSLQKQSKKQYVLSVKLIWFLEFLCYEQCKQFTFRALIHNVFDDRTSLVHPLNTDLLSV